MSIHEDIDQPDPLLVAQDVGLAHPAACERGGWLTRDIAGMGLASLFSDMSHEMATAILPLFLANVLHASPAILGLIEGVADAASSFVKLGSGWFSDRLGRRKELAWIGYLITGLSKSSFAFAQSWPLVLVGRTVGWIGRGIRTPVRDAMLVDAAQPAHYGKVFGFHRAMDTAGAVLGPLIALLLVNAIPLRDIFLVTLIPGILSAAAILFLVRERRRPPHAQRFWTSLGGLPAAFRRFLIAVGVFGLGNFAHTLLILRASELLGPGYGVAAAATWAILLYTVHNVLYAVCSYPIGALSDRIGKPGLLTAGYALFGVMCLGFMLPIHALWYLAILFVLAGVYIALVDAMEGALAADLLPETLRGTGYGALATVNGIGDFASSAVTGFLWASFGSAAGFLYAAILSLAGAAALRLLYPRVKTRKGT